MKREQVKRLMTDTNFEFYSVEAAAALLEGKTYDDVFAVAMPQSGVNIDMWPTFAQLHVLVVKWDPPLAHKWLKLEKQFLLKHQSNAGTAHILGAFLGLLQAGVWLDQHWPEFVAYSDGLLLDLAELVCTKMMLGIMVDNFPKKYTEELTNAIAAYMVPDVERPGRGRLVQAFLQYVRNNSNHDTFTYLTDLIISRVCLGQLAQRSPLEKATALHFLLGTYGPTLKARNMKEEYPPRTRI